MNKPKPKSRGGNPPPGPRNISSLQSYIPPGPENIDHNSLNKRIQAATILLKPAQLVSYIEARDRMTSRSNKQNRTSRSNKPNSRTSQIPELSQRP